MKIVYFIKNITHSGGMERVLSLKANWLVEHGNEVTIITSDGMAEPFFPFDKRILIQALGINYCDSVSRSEIKRKRESHKRKVENLIFQIRPDVSISMFNEEIDFLYKINDGSEKVLEYHFTKDKPIHRTLPQRLAHRMMSRILDVKASHYDAFVVLTKGEMESWNVKGIRSIPNPLMLTAATPSNLSSKEVLAVGRFCYEKGFDRLIRIWNMIPEDLIAQGWKLRIVGDGPLKDSYLQLIESLQISESVELVPTQNDMSKIYEGASIMTVPSYYEGFSMVLLEAQGFGIPSVCYYFGRSITELAENEVTGYIIPQDDEAGFAFALEKLMRDETVRQRMGKIALERSDSFSIDSVMAEWLALFNSIC